eukprot:g8125.t1
MDLLAHHRSTRAFDRSPSVVVCAKTAEYRTYAEALVTVSDHVLEIGCHVGVTTDILARGAGAVIGVDCEVHLIDEARRRFPQHPFAVADATDPASLAAAILAASAAGAGAGAGAVTGEPPLAAATATAPAHAPHRISNRISKVWIDVGGTASAELALSVLRAVEAVLGRGAGLIVIKNLALARLQQQMGRGAAAAAAVGAEVPIPGVSYRDSGLAAGPDSAGTGVGGGVGTAAARRLTAVRGRAGEIDLGAAAAATTDEGDGGGGDGGSGARNDVVCGGGALAVRRWQAAALDALDARFSPGCWQYRVWQVAAAAAFPGRRRPPSHALARAEACLPRAARHRLLRPLLLIQDRASGAAGGGGGGDGAAGTGGGGGGPLLLVLALPAAADAGVTSGGGGGGGGGGSGGGGGAVLRGARRPRPRELRSALPSDFEKAACRWGLAPPFPLLHPAGGGARLRCAMPAGLLLQGAGADAGGMADGSVLLELGIGTYLECAAAELGRMLGAAAIEEGELVV